MKNIMCFMQKKVRKMDKGKILNACFMIILTGILFSLGIQLNASPQKEPVPIPKLESRVKIDGKLLEDSWQKAAKMELEFETSPGENIPPLVKTEVLVFYTKTHLYFALICFDPDPKAIRARYSKRDQIFLDDLININLDTFNDERRNYYLGCNPLGVQRDGLETKWGDPSWDAIWNSAGEINDKGYVLEIAIPFSSLQFQRTKQPQTWGLDISRWYPRSFRHRLGLVKIDRNNNCYQCQFLKIIGFNGVKPGKNIELIPTLTGIKTDARDPFPHGDFRTESEKFDPGITAKWGITPNLTFNGTINPDFSQVEADARQLDINQPFALFYQEKRPFFTEGSDFFRSPLDIIYTRTMREPQWGLKLNGKEGRNTIGAYFVRDELTNLIFPGSQGSSRTSLSHESTATILRYRRDFGTRYTLGGIVTNRQGNDYFNRVYGIDANARITQKDRIEFQLLGSNTQYEKDIAEEFLQPQDDFSGKALVLSYEHISRNVNFFAIYTDIGKNFRADLGFMPQVDFRSYRGEINYRWIKSNSWWSQIEVGLEGDYSKDQNGNFLGEEQGLNFSFQGTMQSYIYIEGVRSREAYNGSIFELLTGRTSLQFQPSRDIQVYLDCNFGDRIDYSISRLGSRFGLYGSITYNLGKKFKLNLDHIYEKMKVNHQPLYTSNITQGSLIFHLNARIFFRGIVQYVDYRYNVDNYTFEIDSQYQELYTQLLFSYRLNPRTVLFLGYTDNYEGHYQDQGNHEFRLTEKDRTFFMKISYSWQF